MKVEEPSALLYVLNVALLTTHQADAAFWREWEVFGIPGGIDFFLVFNLLAVSVLAFGLVRVAQRHPASRIFSLICAATGGVTVALHAFFLFRDRVAFWSPLSLGLFIAIALTSLAQLTLARRARSVRGSPGSS